MCVRKRWFDILGEQWGEMPAWAVLILIGIPIAVVFLFYCPTDHPPPGIFSFIGIVIGFIASAIWVNVFADELVDLLSALGRIFSISELVMGATALSWGNAVGDLMANILLARNKREGMAITACFAVPMFNLLLVLGIGVLLKSINDKNVSPMEDTGLNTQTLLSFIFLAACLVATLGAAFGHGKLTSQGGNRFPEKFALVLFAVYLAYLGVMFGIEFSA